MYPSKNRLQYFIHVRDAPDWDVNDDCDYVYQVKNVNREDLVVIQINIRGTIIKEKSFA